MDDETIVKYVSEMADRNEEYDYTYTEIIDSFQNKDDDVAKKMESIYSKVAGNMFCGECSDMKYYDKTKGEFYCPIHES